LSNISLIQQPGYPPYGYVLTYSTYNNQLNVHFTSISIFGIFDFQKPFQLFIRKDEEVIKANFLLNPGLMVKKPMILIFIGLITMFTISYHWN